MLRAPVSNRGLTISFRCKTQTLTKHSKIMKTLKDKKQTILTKIITPFNTQIIKAEVYDEWKVKIGDITIDYIQIIDNSNEDFQILTNIKTSSIDQIEIVCGVNGIQAELFMGEKCATFDLICDGSIKLIKLL